MTGRQWSAGVLIGVLVGLAGIALPADETPEKWEPVRKFCIELQRVGAKFRPGTTQAQTDVIWPEIAKAVHEEFDGRRVEMVGRLRNVTFRDGRATLAVTSFLPPMKNGPAAPFWFINGGAFDVHCTQEEVLALKPGARVELRAVLTFHPRRAGKVGAATKSQQLWTTYHQAFGAAVVGTFTTSDYELEIDGKPFQGVWNTPDEPMAE